jgi:hypothetical protein
MQPQSNLNMAPGIPLVDIKIDGLAVCCFNKLVEGALKWEVAFLRFKDHDLEITVKKAGSEPDLKIAVPTEVERLNFIVDKPSQAPYQLFKDGYFVFPLEFSRKDLQAEVFGLPVDNDFRWVVDFVDPKVGHGEFVDLITKKDNPKRVKVTLASIPGALFYTETVAEEAVILAPRKKNNPNHGTVFGPTNGVIGACIFAEKAGEVMIKDPGGNMEEIVLPYAEGYINQISVKNMDERKKSPNVAARKAKSNYFKGDFHRYYDVIKVDGEEQEMWARGKEEGERGRLGDCHAVMVNSDTVKNTLEPLLE